MVTKSLKEGMKAPDFTAESDSGGAIRLKDLRGRAVVLYFYPKDNTSGCTKEACAFEDAHTKMRRRGAVVLGVSRDGLKSHAGFREKHNLSFPLLSDPDGALHHAYGVMKEKTMYGKRVMGVDRSTFLIDGAGVIRKIWRGVKVDGHVEEVLEAVKGL